MLELIDVESVSNRQLDPQQYEQKNDDAQPSGQRALIHNGDYSRLPQTPLGFAPLGRDHDDQQPGVRRSGTPFDPSYTLLDQ